MDKIRIGVTGPSGAGKTQICNYITRKLGGIVVDADEVYHRLLVECTELQDRLRAEFGLPDGPVNTKILGSIVYNNKEKLDKLNKITHGYVTKAIDQIIRLRRGKFAVIDAVALIESGAADRCVVVIGVLAGHEKKLERIQKRDNITEEYAQNRLRSQKPDEFFKKQCDYIIINDDIRRSREEAYKIFSEILTRNGVSQFALPHVRRRGDLHGKNRKNKRRAVARRAVDKPEKRL